MKKPMKVITVGRCFTALLFSLATFHPVLAIPYTISPGWEIDINDASSLLAGSIARLTAPDGSILFQNSINTGLLDWNVGVERPTEVSIESRDESLLCVLSGFRSSAGQRLPMRIELTFEGNRGELYVAAMLIASGTCRLDQGLAISIPTYPDSEVDFYNTMGRMNNRVVPPGIPAPFRLPSQNRITIVSREASLQVNIRNPILPVPIRAADGVRLEIMAWYRPYTTNSGGLANLCSILQSGDTVRAEWGLMPLYSSDQAHSVAYFSPHPDGGDCSATLAFDDIPSFEADWSVPTDANNPYTPVASGWLALLDQFPDVKFTWLMLTDGIQRLGVWNYPGWWPPNNFVAPDLTIVNSGKYSARLFFTEGASAPGVITSQIRVKPGTTHRLEFSGYADVESPGMNLAVYVRDWPMSNHIADRLYNFPKGEWQHNNVEFVSDSMGTASLIFRYTGPVGSFYLDDVHCYNLETGEDMQRNGDFEVFQPFLQYDSADSSWASAHGHARVATEAPPEYRHWLKAVQDESPEWDYARQLGLGLHGKHHTPDTLFAYDVQHTHEFNFFDPVGDSIRMKHITEDIDLMGLDRSKIFGLFRFPGHRHTESLLKPLFDHGVRIIDQGNFIDVFCGGMLMRQHSRLWVTSSVSWHDKYNEAHMVHLEETLDAGMFALMGCHYHIMNSISVPGERERARQFFDWLERTYPHLVWLKGDELADLWDEFGAIRNIRQEGYGNSISVTWDGATTEGETCVVTLPSTANRTVIASVDGQSLSAEQRGDMIFVPLPSLGSGSHKLILKLTNGIQFEGETRRWRITPFDSDQLTFSRFSSSSSELEILFYDVMGRRVGGINRYSLIAGNQALTLRVPGKASSIYFVRIREGSEEITLKLPQIR